MTRSDDASRIRALLETERPWAAYALGDLAPPHWERCEWLVSSSEPPALVLLYRAFSTPVLFTLGHPDPVAALLEQIEEPVLDLSIRPEILPVVRQRYAVEQERAMCRMLLEVGRLPLQIECVAERLTPEDADSIQHLYEDGAAGGEAPDFFAPEMLRDGVLFGIREGQELVSVAGTHLIAHAESVGAVGNVYTRRDHRGRGLAGRVTAAVTVTLVRMGLRTIVLNVNLRNLPAVRIYERLGFLPYCRFIEGLARLSQEHV